MNDTCLMIKYKEEKLPNAKYLAGSWMQLKVFHQQGIIVAFGDADILDHMCTDVRNHAQRHKQDILTTCFHYIDPHDIHYYAPEIQINESRSTEEKK